MEKENKNTFALASKEEDSLVYTTQERHHYLNAVSVKFTIPSQDIKRKEKKIKIKIPNFSGRQKSFQLSV